MGLSVSITEVQILTGLRAFLLDVLAPGTEVIRSQVNRVAEPASPTYVMVTPGNRSRLSTNVKTVDTTSTPAVAMNVTQATQLQIQLDFHGPGGSDNHQIVMMMFRDSYAVDFLSAYGIAPLFADDGHQVPFINGENQYEDRWIATVTLQFNPTISTPQQFADSINIGLIEIEATFP